MQEFAFRKRADIGKSNRARKLTPLKSVGLAFRKDKGDFKSGSKENNSCARDGAGAGCLDKRNSNTLVSLGIFGGFA